LRDRAAEASPAILDLGPLRIDAADHAATLDGEPIHLTRREFDLLWMLASHRGRLVTQAMILKSIWGPAHAEDSQYLRVYIRQLRQKLGDNAANPRFIATEPGIGYRFLEPLDP
jgi:two-component system KDP operon response regulator KdpE